MSCLSQIGGLDRAVPQPLTSKGNDVTLNKANKPLMGAQEQKEEREVIDAIFPDEIQDISPSEYRVTVNLELEKEASAQDDEETPADPAIILHVRYPEAYPDEPPILDLFQPPNASKHIHLDVRQDKAQLLESLQPTIDENMSMAMVYALITSLKEAAEQLVADRIAALQAQKDLELQKAEEEENRKFEGEKVTKESFMAWRERFQKEMREEAERKHAELEAEEKKRRGGKAEEKRLTGKQLWLQGLAGKGADEYADGVDVMESLKDLKVEE
ncbi:RWD-domain-containing protein [Piedraia hortae CBS 480.64]|uniref:RWD-domain-containing protein n=1 Tax=Piedraia hortae CBS 480.64 TaxID=1314780 RepID=A0A6A7C6E5_9PEZI|nr:RWD-domain-containing protein [Piedraia hortae CBS 480.64]